MAVLSIRPRVTRNGFAHCGRMVYSCAVGMLQELVLVAGEEKYGYVAEVRDSPGYLFG